MFNIDELLQNIAQNKPLLIGDHEKAYDFIMEHDV